MLAQICLLVFLCSLQPGSFQLNSESRIVMVMSYSKHLYLPDQTPRLLFISSRNFVRLLFESGYYSRAATIREQLLFESSYYSRAAFIKLSGIGKTFCKCKCIRSTKI